MSTETHRRIVDAATWKDASDDARRNLAVAKSHAEPVEVRDVRTTAGEPVERAAWFTVSTEGRDRDRDRISLRGWDLGNFRHNPVVPWAHNYSILPIGRAVEVVLDLKGGRLRMLKQFAPREANPLADSVLQLVTLGFLKTCSVGFIPKEYERDNPLPNEDPERAVGYLHLRQELLESSVVPIPSNPEALAEARSVHRVDLAPVGEWAERILAEQPDRGLWIPRKDLEQAARIAGPQRSFFLVGTGKPAIEGAGTVTTRAPEGGIPVTTVADAAAAPSSTAPVAEAIGANDDDGADAEPDTEIEDAEPGVLSAEAKGRAFRPPQTVQSAARHGLNLRREFKRGGTKVGVARAVQLANGRAVSEDTIYRMASYFARHAVDRNAPGWGNESDPSAGYVAWLLWGGDPGRTWSNAIKERLDAAEERSMTITTTTEAPRSEPSPSVVAVSAAPSGAAKDAVTPPPQTDGVPSSTEVVPADGSGDASQPAAGPAIKSIDDACAALRAVADFFFGISDPATLTPRERVIIPLAIAAVEGATDLLGLPDVDVVDEGDGEGEEPAEPTEPAPAGEPTMLATPEPDTKTPTSHQAADNLSLEALRAFAQSFAAEIRG